MNKLNKVGQLCCALLSIALLSMTSILGISASVAAETDNTIIQPNMYYALVLEMSEGVEFEFSLTSSVAIYVFILDSTNFNSYSSTFMYSSALFETTNAVTSASGTVEAPETGKYYLVMENVVSTSPASVSVEYEFLGTGFQLTWLGYAVIIGVVLIVVGFLLRRASSKKSKQANQEEISQRPPPTGPYPPNPP